jgi:O-antigen/teichoic acid export membrane protein
MIPDADRIAKAVRVLATGRAPGVAIAFAIPLVLARTFDQAEFGTYKQLFLIYATLFGLAQLGMAESLYYFVPRDAAKAGRHAANAITALAIIGLGCVAALFALRFEISEWLSNPALSTHLVPLGWFLALMLTSAVFEIVLISRQKPAMAATAYALSDLARAACFVIPAALAYGLRGVMAGAVLFAATRAVITALALWREFGPDLRIDARVLARQLAYALPFALAVGIEVLHLNWHQYAVAARFDAATFAVYAVGCLQVPVVDLIVTSAVNVMMVEMAAVKERHPATARWLWHDTITRLGFMIFPLAAFLIVMAREIITVLFTSAYAGSVPIFMLWSLTMLASVLVVDGVLRVFAQTKYLVAQNVAQLLLVAALAGPLLSMFGLGGAVLATLVAAMAVKAAAVVRISRLMGLSLADALPWRRLATAATCAGVAALPTIALARNAQLPPLAALPIAALVYTAAYALLCYAIGRAARPRLVQAAPTTV